MILAPFAFVSPVFFSHAVGKGFLTPLSPSLGMDKSSDAPSQRDRSGDAFVGDEERTALFRQCRQTAWERSRTAAFLPRSMLSERQIIESFGGRVMSFTRSLQYCSVGLGTELLRWILIKHWRSNVVLIMPPYFFVREVVQSRLLASHVVPGM